MKITRKQLKEMVKESIIKETTGAEKAMQSAKIKKDIETLNAKWNEVSTRIWHFIGILG